MGVFLFGKLFIVLDFMQYVTKRKGHVNVNVNVFISSIILSKKGILLYYVVMRSYKAAAVKVL